MWGRACRINVGEGLWWWWEGHRRGVVLLFLFHSDPIFSNQGVHAVQPLPIQFLFSPKSSLDLTLNPFVSFVSVYQSTPYQKTTSVGSIFICRNMTIDLWGWWRFQIRSGVIAQLSNYYNVIPTFKVLPRNLPFITPRFWEVRTNLPLVLFCISRLLRAN